MSTQPNLHASTSAPQIQTFENAVLRARVPDDLKLMKLTNLPADWEARVIGFRRGITFSRFLRMKLFAPLFPAGSIQAAARRELQRLKCFGGTRNDSSAALTAHVLHSDLYPVLGYWDTRRALRCIFDIYNAVCKVIERNDLLIVSLIERPKRSAAYKVREQTRLRARHSRNQKEIRKAKRAVLARLYKRVRMTRWQVMNLERGAKQKLARAKAAKGRIQDLLHRADGLERELKGGLQS